MTRRSIIVVLVVVAAAGLAAVAAVALMGDDGSSTDPRVQGRERPPANPSNRSARVWAVGDGADGGAAAKRVADVIERTRPDRLLYLGDVYESGTASEFEHRYDPVYGRFAAITAPTPGNHDWPNREEGYDPYWRSANPRIPRDRHFYRFTAGGWEFLSLNTESGLEADSPQMRWLREQVRRPGNCRIAFWHRPYLNAGRHGDQEDVAPLWRAIRGHAVLVLSGHDHNLQHFEPEDGVTQLISGAGGHGFYESDENDPRLVWDEDDQYGAVRLDLRPRVARFSFVDDEGNTLHRGRVRCRP